MIILITGISSGFGKAMAGQLSAEGHRVYGTYRRECEHIEGVHYIKCEVTDIQQVEATVRTVLDAEGKIDVFINNAGGGIGGPLEFTSPEDARKLMEVNWMGMVNFLHFVLPPMRKAGKGKILCFSSIGGLMGLPYQGVYSASKFAIEGYCEALRLELCRSGISVTVIQPGDFATKFTASRQNLSGDEVAKAYPGYARSLGIIEDNENGGLKADFLARRISRIVKSKNPPYSAVIATWDQKLSVLLKRILPERCFAWILKLYYKL
ncbi:MAG: SDR family NAD(P)-dependent oxidoreductase [Bacteroidales bacterium]|nr:SDR family NAD(P)-dependent oxidoreductase [Bacteroidales bacterium]